MILLDRNKQKTVGSCFLTIVTQQGKPMSRTTWSFLFLTCWLWHCSQRKLLSGDTAYRMRLSNSHPFMMDGHRKRCLCPAAQDGPWKLSVASQVSRTTQDSRKGGFKLEFKWVNKLEDFIPTVSCATPIHNTEGCGCGMQISGCCLFVFHLLWSLSLYSQGPS